VRIAVYLDRIRKTEGHLAHALEAVADRHSSDPDLRDPARLLAGWARAHLEWLAPYAERYGRQDSPDPDHLRGALFHGDRSGGLGALRDVQDLAVLANALRAAWTILYQAAMEIHDEELRATAARAGEDVDRQLAWLKTRIRLMAPQALTVEPARRSALYAALPRQPSLAGLPDALWAPVAGGALTLVVGAAALAIGQPWLAPSLGPTAYLQAEQPAHPAAKAYNVIVGHVVGLGAGFVALAAFGAWGAPPVLSSGQLTGQRVGAAVLALVLTIAGALALRATHPPAAATALLVALGSLQTAPQAAHVAIGAVVIALAGEALRRLRLAGGRRLQPVAGAVAARGSPSPTQSAAPELRKAA
jgi:hypothetical protein